MDEVFGSENFVRLISFRTTSGLSQKVLDKACDYIVWYAKNADSVKYRPLYEPKMFSTYKNSYTNIELRDGQRMTIKDWEAKNGLLTKDSLPEGADICTFGALSSQSGSGAEIVIAGQTYTLRSGSYKTTQKGIDNLQQLNRIEIVGRTPRYIRYYSDFPYQSIDNMWDVQMSEQNKSYVVQTSTKAIQRCLLMTTDPGDIVLDPPAAVAPPLTSPNSGVGDG